MVNITAIEPGHLEYTDARGFRHIGRFDLFLIAAAFEKGVSFEDLADGFGKGLGTMGGDWSGIRDSSEAATVKMLERAITALGLER